MGNSYNLDRVVRKLHITRTGEKPYHKQEALQDVLAVMIDSLMEQRPVNLSYYSHASQRTSVWRVHPLTIVFHRGGVYFVVDSIHPTEPSKRLSLKLEGMRDVVLDRTVDPFDYPTDFSAEEFFADCWGIDGRGAVQEVVIRISPTLKAYVQERSWMPTAKFADDEHGYLLMTVWVTANNELFEWVAGMRQHAEILSPPDARSAMASHLEAALNLYR